MNKLRKLIHKLSKESMLYSSPIHGIKHWLTVERNALYLASLMKPTKRFLVYLLYYMTVKEKVNILTPSTVLELQNLLILFVENL